MGYLIGLGIYLGTTVINQAMFQLLLHTEKSRFRREGLEFEKETLSEIDDNALYEAPSVPETNENDEAVNMP